MRIERIVLEHHRDVAILRVEVVHHPLADLDPPAGDFLETGDHPQQRRFPASRRTDQNDELPVARLDVDVANDLHRAEILFDVLDFHSGHAASPEALAVALDTSLR